MNTEQEGVQAGMMQIGFMTRARCLMGTRTIVEQCSQRKLFARRHARPTDAHSTHISQNIGNGATFGKAQRVLQLATVRM